MLGNFWDGNLHNNEWSSSQSRECQESKAILEQLVSYNRKYIQIKASNSKLLYYEVYICFLNLRNRNASPYLIKKRLMNVYVSWIWRKANISGQKCATSFNERDLIDCLCRGNLLWQFWADALVIIFSPNNTANRLTTTDNCLMKMAETKPIFKSYSLQVNRPARFLEASFCLVLLLAALLSGCRVSLLYHIFMNISWEQKQETRRFQW